jgi:hypothetical protein
MNQKQIITALHGIALFLYPHMGQVSCEVTGVRSVGGWWGLMSSVTGAFGMDIDCSQISSTTLWLGSAYKLFI